MEGGPLDSPTCALKGEAILERELEPSFRLALAAKDARLVVEAARGRGRRPALAAARCASASGRAAELGHGDEDMAATYFAAVRG